MIFEQGPEFLPQLIAAFGHHYLDTQLASTLADADADDMRRGHDRVAVSFEYLLESFVSLRHRSIRRSSECNGRPQQDAAECRSQVCRTKSLHLGA